MSLIDACFPKFFKFSKKFDDSKGLLLRNIFLPQVMCFNVVIMKVTLLSGFVALRHFFGDCRV